MGNIPMECPDCGTTNINKMLVTFNYLSNGEKVLDTTTLPKYLYMLEHPDDHRMKGGHPINLLDISCFSCRSETNTGVGRKIKTRRYGI